MNQQKVLLTQQGLQDLKKELDELTNKKRPAAVTRVATARDQGDLSENSEYTAARDELNFIDGRITELEEILRVAKVVTHTTSTHKVDVGSKVRVNLKNREDTFHIVGEHESNPLEKKISYSSPLGKALIGRKVGEEIEVEAPAGKIVYKIMHIE